MCLISVWCRVNSRVVPVEVTLQVNSEKTGEIEFTFATLQTRDPVDINGK
jgi:hypothetical protein